MRCPSCGTQNEVDSRFCGGCGARLNPSRLAPTQKILDDAPLPAQPHVAPRTSGSQPPQASIPPPIQPMAPSVNRPPRMASGPPAMPAPTAMAPAAKPDVRPIPQAQPPARPAASLAADRDDSIIVPKRRWGLIVGVLVVDLGLAAAGAWMLAQGLKSPDKPVPPSSAGSAAVKTGTLQGRVDPPPTAAAVSTNSPTPAPAPTATPPLVMPADVAAPAKSTTSAPVDPYAN